MVSSSPRGAQPGLSARQGDGINVPNCSYFVTRRAAVHGFVDRHFTWPGTLFLHSAALGADVLRAPVNVVLSPVLVLTLSAAYVCRRVGLHRAANWLARRRILLRTAVARRVEGLVMTDLLGLPPAKGTAADDPNALARAVLAAPQFRDMIRQRATPAEAEAVGQRVANAVGDYAGTRSAVAEMTTTLCILLIGALVFHALTPGMISMAPDVAQAVALRTAIADFPMGQTLGGAWYGMFGTGASVGLIALTLAALLMAGAVVAAFAGVLADPVQARLGIHQRRLQRLIDTLEAELVGQTPKPFAAREHFYARFMDLWDAAASAFRLFRS